MARSYLPLLVAALALLCGASTVAAQNRTRCGLNSFRNGRTGECMCGKTVGGVRMKRVISKNSPPGVIDCCPSNSYIAGTGRTRQCKCKAGFLFSKPKGVCRNPAASSDIPEVYALCGERFKTQFEAAGACRNMTSDGGTLLASLEQVQGAYSAGADWCCNGFTGSFDDNGVPLTAYPGGACSGDSPVGVVTGVADTSENPPAIGAICFGRKPDPGEPGVQPFNSDLWTQFVCLGSALPDPPVDQTWPSSCKYTPFNSLCQSTCGTGYLPTPFFSTCLGGQWSNVTGDCTPIPVCGAPPTITGGSFSCGGGQSAVGSTCEAVCDAGLVGDVSITCDEGGVWSAVKGSCKPGCSGKKLPDQPANGAWPGEDCFEVLRGQDCTGKCDLGFKGAPKTTCNADGSFTATTGACKESTDPCTGTPPNPPTGATFNCPASTPHLSTCNGTCPRGFFGSPAGSPVATCFAGTWSPVQGVCAEGCLGTDLPALANGAWGNCATTAVGNICLGKCNSGFAGGPSAFCIGADTWDVTGSCFDAPGACKGNPPAVPNAKWDCGDITGGGQTCTAECNDGFAGSPSKPSSSCGNDDKWAAPKGSCVASSAVCGTPPSAPNAAFNCAGNNKAGDDCFSTCNSGFIANPLPPYITCLRNGTWSGIVNGTCVQSRTSCSGNPSSSITNGKFACASTPVGSNCTASCNPGYEGPVVATCLTGGLWDEVTSNCRAVCSGAAIPPPPANSKWVTTCTSGSVTVDGGCSADCDDGYLGSPQVNCDGPGKWGDVTGGCTKKNDTVVGPPSPSP
ncbi:Svep1 [Scenedesmus sp. PABB004]|nr:Svep1 [Scenedesmus sp. PABB004]